MLNQKETALLDIFLEELEEKFSSLQIEQALLELDGVTPQIAIALAEGGVKTVEDLAGLVSDDLRGWFEVKNGERVREAGILDSFNLSSEDADAMIMAARVAMGWVEAATEETEEAASTDGQA